MNRALGLKVLRDIMQWEDDEAREEFDWLTFMSDYKYDSYRDYLAGARFIENLSTWLQQFDLSERPIAYQFIKEKLIYFSNSEIQRLVEKFYPDFVQPDLVARVSEALEIPKYRVWSSQESVNRYRVERRCTLFMALSDGARVDALRRSNVGVISNEQVVIATEVNQRKWNSLLKKLRKDLHDLGVPNASSGRFTRVYLLDDFTASGTSLLRHDADKPVFDGKLPRFAASVREISDASDGESPFVDGYAVYVHHFIGTEQARTTIADTYDDARFFLNDHGIEEVRFSFGMTLPPDIRMASDASEPFSVICRKYYDQRLDAKGEHDKQSGVKGKMFGYAECGVPIVLEHNTPNNSLPLLWADTPDSDDRRGMRPLFRRRERHSDMDIEEQ